MANCRGLTVSTVEHALLEGPAQHAETECVLDELRKQRHDDDAHRPCLRFHGAAQSSGCQSTVTRPAPRSTATSRAGTNGTNRSTLPSRNTSSGCAGISRMSVNLAERYAFAIHRIEPQQIVQVVLLGAGGRQFGAIHLDLGAIQQPCCVHVVDTFELYRQRLSCTLRIQDPHLPGLATEQQGPPAVACDTRGRVGVGRDLDPTLHAVRRADPAQHHGPCGPATAAASLGLESRVARSSRQERVHGPQAATATWVLRWLLISCLTRSDGWAPTPSQ